MTNEQYEIKAKAIEGTSRDLQKELKKALVNSKDFFSEKFSSKQKIQKFAISATIPAPLEMKYWRISLGIKQADVKHKVGFNISRYENLHNDIQVETLRKLIKYYKNESSKL